MPKGSLTFTTPAFAPLERIVWYQWREYRKQPHYRLRIAALTAAGLSLGSLVALVFGS